MRTSRLFATGMLLWINAQALALTPNEMSADSPGGSSAVESSPSDRYLTGQELRTLNLQVSPIATAFKRYNASLDVGLTEHFTLGPKGTWYQDASDTIIGSARGYEVGLRGNFYVTGKRYTESLLIRPGIYYGHWNTSVDLADAIANAFTNAIASALGATASDQSTRDVVDGPVFQTVVAYQAVFSNGFNLDLGGGFQAYRERHKAIDLRTGSSIDYRAATIEFSPLVEFNVGWAF